MDIFAHGLWTNAVFYKKYKNNLRDRIWAVVFGLLPDLVSFSPIFIYSFISRVQFWDLIAKNTFLVRYASESYNYTHSMIFFVIALVIVTVIRKGRVWWPMFGWALHIFIDIFTHHGFYETPFLFPFSHYKFDYGVSWGTPWFMAVNYSALIITYIIIYILNRNKSVV